MAEVTDSELAVLEGLKRERDELNGLIEGLEKRIAFRGGGTVGNSISSGKIGPDEFFRLRTPDAIKKFLKIVGKPARATTDIIDGLKRGGMNTNYTNVYTALTRLAAKSEAVKVGENWGLDEWYPPAPARELKSVMGNFNEAEAIAETQEKTEETAPDNQDASDETESQFVQPVHNLGRKGVIARFIKEHGPSTRTEILAGTDVPSGSFAYCVNDKDLFIKGEDGKYRNVE